MHIASTEDFLTGSRPKIVSRLMSIIHMRCKLDKGMDKIDLKD